MESNVSVVLKMKPRRQDKNLSMRLMANVLLPSTVTVSASAVFEERIICGVVVLMAKRPRPEFMEVDEVIVRNLPLLGFRMMVELGPGG